MTGKRGGTRPGAGRPQADDDKLLVYMAKLLHTGEAANVLQAAALAAAFSTGPPGEATVQRLYEKFKLWRPLSPALRTASAIIIDPRRTEP
jgi:hypothetical protein